MQLSPVYEQRLAEAEQRGIQRGVEQGLQQGVEQGLQRGVEQGLQQGIQVERSTTITNLLQVRFGTMDAQLAAIVEPLLRLSPEEFMPLLLQLSREELLARFSQP